MQYTIKELIIDMLTESDDNNKDLVFKIKTQKDEYIFDEIEKMYIEDYSDDFILEFKFEKGSELDILEKDLEYYKDRCEELENDIEELKNNM